MSNAITNASNRVVVISHVQPSGNEMGFAGITSSPQSLGQTVSTMLGKFRVGQPKALGTLQIMIGVIMLLVGIIMASSFIILDNVGVLTGFFVWGSIIYVIAGSLTVAADNHLNKCLVKGSLGMNVVSTVTAFVGIILYFCDAVGTLMYYYCYYYQGNNTWSPGHQEHEAPFSSSNCRTYMSRSQGISGLLVVLSLLEFIVSICVSSFACKAVCHCCHCCDTPEQVTIYGNQILVPHGGIVAPSNPSFLPSYENVNYPKEREGHGVDRCFQQDNPPPFYTASLNN